MPIPLIPIAIASFAAGMLRRHGENKQEEFADQRKQQQKSTDAFIKVLGEMSQSGDVTAIEGLKDRVTALPSGAALYEGALAQAHSGQFKQQSMQGLIQALLGSGQGQGDAPFAAGGATPGAPPLAGPPSAPTATATVGPTTPQQDLSGVSRQIADINQTPTLQRTPQQVAQRGQLIDTESQLTDKLLQASPNQGEDFYDYAAAKKAGVLPRPDPTDLDENGKPRLHWDSRFKFDNHPNRFIPSELGVFDSKYSRMVSEQDFARTATAQQQATFNAHQTPLPAAEVQGYLNNAAERPPFPTLPGILKMKGITTITIPKDVFGIEIHGSKAEALSGVVGAARQRGFGSGEIYQQLKAQGIDPPEQLSHQAFNEFAGKYLTSEEFLKNPRKALQEIANNFPSTDPKALTGFGQQAFTSAYIGAKERLRKTGQYVSDRALAQGAFQEAVGAVGSEFVPDSVMQDLDRAKASTTDNLMVELLDKALAGNKAAMSQYGIMLQMHAGKIATEEAARRIAGIKAEQGAAFMTPDTLKDIQRPGGGTLPFGTTQAGAAGAAVIPPETQAARTTLADKTTIRKFAASQSLPVFSSFNQELVKINTLAGQVGLMGKAAGKFGLESTKLGQLVTDYDEARMAFARDFSAVAGQSSGVITDSDVTDIVGILPKGKEFVNLVVDNHELLISKLSRVQQTLSFKLGENVEPFKDIIQQLTSRGVSENKFGKVLEDFEKTLKGTKK